MTAANRNTLWARAFVDELARSGLEHVALAPGSRSTPLVIAAAEHPGITAHTLIDERSAAFLALGLGKASGRPAAVITTSGTATANLHPAVIEAYQSQQPLILLTADRPHRLRGSDANQAIDQVKLYGDHLVAFHEIAPPTIDGPSLRHLRQVACRAVAQATGPPAGPVHLNLPFPKPLEPTEVPGDVPQGFETEHPLAATGRPGGAPFVDHTPGRAQPAPADLQRLVEVIEASPRGLIVAGPHPEPDRLGPAVLELARATGYPVLADPLSGARFRPGATGHALGAYDLLLGSPRARSGLAPDLVLRVGLTPTSQQVAGYLEHHNGTRQVLIDAGRRYTDHLAVATDHLATDAPATLTALAEHVSQAADKAWASRWHGLEAQLRGALPAVHAEGGLEGTVLADTAAAVPDGTALFVSNSMPVRDLDTFAAPREATIHAHGNRGASGIDGIVSTAAGLALTHPAPTVAVLGDLALLHDTNGLQALAKAQPDLTLVVIDNDGGGIFHQLPIRDHEPAFTDHFTTPHGLDLAKAADLHQLDHQHVQGRKALAEALAERLEAGGPGLLQVTTDRQAGHARRQVITDQLTRTIETTLQEEPP